MRPLLPIAGVLALALFSACSPTIEGACKVDTDCKTGTICVKEDGADEGLCVTSGPITCGLACGEGFFCTVKTSDGTEDCEPNAGEEGVATITVPENGSAVTGVVQVTCKVVAPQLRMVTMSIHDIDGVPVSLPAPVARDGLYVAAWDTTTLREGRYVIDCESTYGPEGRGRPIKATPSQVLVDRTTPKLRQLMPSEWAPQQGMFDFTFEAKDEGSGLVPEAVVVTSAGLGTVVATARGQDTWVAVIDRAKLQPPGGEGPVIISVAATDRAGNTGRAEMTLPVDGKPPTVGPMHEQPWHAFDGGTFTLSAPAVATGAPMDTASARFVGPGGYEVVGTFVDESVSFVIDPQRLGTAGAEQQVQGTISVVDQVGQKAETAVVLPIDAKGPTVSITAVTGWRRRGDSASVRVSVADAAMGVDPTTVRVRGGGPCSPAASGEFTCSVSTSTAPAGVETAAFAFTIDASDAGANVGSASSSLAVDDVPPLLSFAATSPTFGARAPSHVVQGRASDVGAGLDASSVRVVVGARSYAGTYDAAAGTVSVPTTPSEFSTAGQTTSATLTLAVKDLSGLETFISRTLVVDDQAPQITPGTPVYPHTDTLGPYVQRNESLTFTATLTDPANGSGIDPATVVVRYTKRDGPQGTVAGTLSSGSTYSFTVAASDLALTASTDTSLARLARGTAELTIAASDRMGNEATGRLTINVSRKLWEFDTGAGARVLGSVAIDGTNVYFTLARQGAAGSDNVWAVARSTGTKAWSAYTAGTPLTPVTISDTRAYFVANDAQGSYLDGWALTGGTSPQVRCGNFGNAGDGAALALGRYPWGSAGVRDTLFIGSATYNRVYAIAHDGSQCRTEGTLIPGPSDTNAGYDPSHSTIALDDAHQNLWFGTYDGRVGVVPINVSGTFAFGATAWRSNSSSLPLTGLAVTADGYGLSLPGSKMQLWSAASTTPVWESASLGTSRVTAPAIVYGETAAYGIYGFGGETGRLHAVHSINGPVNGFPSDVSSPVRGSPTIDVQSVAYAVTADGLVRAVGYDGRSRWIYDTGASNVVSQSPVLACDGTLYVGTSAGKIVALSSDGSGLINSSWPRYQHDNRNTGNTSTALRVSGICRD